MTLPPAHRGVIAGLICAVAWLAPAFAGDTATPARTAEEYAQLASRQLSAGEPAQGRGIPRGGGVEGSEGAREQWDDRRDRRERGDGEGEFEEGACGDHGVR